MIKSITAYLQAAGITDPAAIAAATSALTAMQTDAQSDITAANTSAQQARDQVQNEIRENQQARALAGAFRKVAGAAKVDLDALSDSGISQERRRELSDAAAQQVLDFVGSAGSTADDASAILKAAGFDVDAYQKAGKEKRAELAKGFAEKVTGNEVKLRTGERDRMLTEAKLDPKKTGRIIGDVQLVKGKTTVKDAAGKDVEVDTIGTLDDRGAFTPISQTLNEAGWEMADLTLKNGGGDTNTAGGAAGGQGDGLDWLLNAGQSPAASGGSDNLLGFLTAPPASDGKGQ